MVPRISLCKYTLRYRELIKLGTILCLHTAKRVKHGSKILSDFFQASLAKKSTPNGWLDSPSNDPAWIHPPSKSANSMISAVKKNRWITALYQQTRQAPIFPEMGLFFQT